MHMGLCAHKTMSLNSSVMHARSQQQLIKSCIYAHRHANLQSKTAPTPSSNTKSSSQAVLVLLLPFALV
jgi:hypothetical protein